MSLLTNRYSAVYFKLVERAKGREGSYRYHSHHVVPRSIGGSNCKTNRVWLTPTEHYVCHLLLVKMTDGPNQLRMIAAATLLAVQLGKPRIFKRVGRLPLKKVHPRLKRDHTPQRIEPRQPFTRASYRRNCLGKIKITNGESNRTVSEDEFDQLQELGWRRGITRRQGTAGKTSLPR